MNEDKLSSKGIDEIHKALKLEDEESNFDFSDFAPEGYEISVEENTSNTSSDEKFDIRNLTLKNHLDIISLEVFKRIDFSWKFNFRLSEETITEEYIIYRFYLLALEAEINHPLTLLEAKKEHLTGNDIEIVLETEKGFVIFPCQAKKIKKNLKYTALNHKVNSSQKYQIDLLIDYAKRIQGIPIYLMYNHIDLEKLTKKQQIKLGKVDKKKDILKYGCSIINANLVKEGTRRFIVGTSKVCQNEIKY